MEKSLHQQGSQFHRAIYIWLIIGFIMVLGQIFLGGYTRLSGSGLSITKWDIATGTLPPLNEAQWEEAFDLYKATPQYEKINSGMNLKEFKFIYFWEYFHRLWARLLGFVFLIPAIVFAYKGWLDAALRKKLVIAVGIGALAAIFGWIMVASGLVDRPWVNAYKLLIHLGIGIGLCVYMCYVCFWYKSRDGSLRKWTQMNLDVSKGLVLIFLFLIGFQLLTGALMSGMHAALFFPTWPKIGMEWIPSVLKDYNNWQWVHLVDYDDHIFMPSLVHLVHRTVPYIIVLWYVFTFKQYIWKHTSIRIILYFLILQMFLGILVLIGSKSGIPIDLAILHQLLGILFFCYSVMVYIFIVRKEQCKVR